MSGSGKWNPGNVNIKPMRAPKGLSVDAPEFVPKSSTVNQQQLPPQLVQQQQIPLQHHQAAYVGRDLDLHNSHPEPYDKRLFYTSGGGGGGGGGAVVDNNTGKHSVQDRLRNSQMANANYSNHNHHHVVHMPQQPHMDGVNMNAYNQNMNNHPLLSGTVNSLGNRLQNMRIDPPNAIEPVVEDKQQASESESMALTYLSEVMTKLYDNPGLFETYIKKLKDVFSELKNNHFVMSNAVEMIFEQSINEQNFRYMGARLCSLMDELDVTQESVFRHLLRMKMEYQQTELIGYMQNEQRKVRGATLFLAEVYMQLRKPHDVIRNNEISVWIVEAIKLLLSKKGPENAKCVCQTLKLCGFELELDRSSEMNVIIHALAELETTTDHTTGRLVRSVLDLQGNRWGREDPTVNQPQPVLTEHNQQPLNYNDSPVFYGPDGQILTEEENSFLETLPNLDFEEFDDEDPDELVDDDDGIDLEIRMAFKDFVQQSARKQ